MSRRKLSRLGLCTSLLAVLALGSAPIQAKSQRSEADLALYRQAMRECKSWKYIPDGASIHINYAKGWFRCEYRGDRKRDNRKR